ncbi:hypothetical protein [Rhodobacter ferrooxidans]|uniref:Uncharacterized protein n=1 Tax=Rhodobacter ferrooxidans TaxID=371731 RepID=C8S1H6_9RHOB|nr:hypothetical protein [Rhodobacter sp. SW2]EEW25149.1 hypothetical protein Rsw2DRAFT_1904 [Rhodobacter sp. SW2]
MHKFVLAAALSLAPASVALAEVSKTDLGLAAKPAFAPGSHGEPFIVQGLVQGCTLIDNAPFCAFYAEGWRWYGSETATNPATLKLLEDLPVNTPIEVKGDIISQGDITIEAAISSMAVISPDAFAPLRDMMQGGWIDATDPQNELQVLGSEEVNFYAGDIVETDVLTFADQCPDGPEGVGPVITKQMMGGDPMDVPCFYIVSLTPDRMELSYVGRGNTLIFNRK